LFTFPCFPNSGKTGWGVGGGEGRGSRAKKGGGERGWGKTGGGNCTLLIGRCERGKGQGAQ